MVTREKMNRICKFTFSNPSHKFTLKVWIIVTVEWNTLTLKSTIKKAGDGHWSKCEREYHDFLSPSFE